MFPNKRKIEYLDIFDPCFNDTYKDRFMLAYNDFMSKCGQCGSKIDSAKDIKICDTCTKLTQFDICCICKRKIYCHNLFDNLLTVYKNEVICRGCSVIYTLTNMVIMSPLSLNFTSDKLLNREIYSYVDWYNHCFPRKYVLQHDNIFYIGNNRDTRDTLALRQKSNFMNKMSRFNRADKLVCITNIDLYNTTFHYECTEGFKSVRDIYRRLALIMWVLEKQNIKFLPRVLRKLITEYYTECKL